MIFDRHIHDPKHGRQKGGKSFIFESVIMFAKAVSSILQYACGALAIALSDSIVFDCTRGGSVTIKLLLY